MQDADGHGFEEADMSLEKLLSRPVGYRIHTSPRPPSAPISPLIPSSGVSRVSRDGGCGAGPSIRARWRGRYSG